MGERYTLEFNGTRQYETVVQFPCGDRARVKHKGGGVDVPGCLDVVDELNRLQDRVDELRQKLKRYSEAEIEFGPTKTGRFTQTMVNGQVVMKVTYDTEIADRAVPTWESVFGEPSDPVSKGQAASYLDQDTGELVVIDQEILPDEWTIVPFEDEDRQDTPVDHDAPLPRWQDRLVFDSNISEESPVIRGTWVTVSQIVSLVVDGYTWADILRSHPELTEEDIRVCLSHATQQDIES